MPDDDLDQLQLSDSGLEPDLLTMRDAQQDEEKVWAEVAWMDYSCVPARFLYPARGLSLTMFTVFTAAAMGVIGTVGLLCFLEASHAWGDIKGPVDYFSLIILFLPFITLLCVIGFPPARLTLVEYFVEPAVRVAFFSLVPATYAVATFLHKEPNMLAILGLGGIFALLVLHGMENRVQPLLVSPDVGLWLPLYFISDFRWYNYGLFYTDFVIAYDWWGILLSSWFFFTATVPRQLSGFGTRLVPTVRDLILASLGVVIVAGPIIPIGLLTGFLTFPPTEPVTFKGIVSSWIENFMTVSIPEEILFRVLLFGVIVKRFPERRWWTFALASSMLFGISHWPRMDNPIMLLLYIIFAAINGFVECVIYKLSGMNIVAGAIMHSTVDCIWGNIFS